MTHSRITDLLIILIFVSLGLNAQDSNIFSEKNTAGFAGFLYNTNQYRYAAEEYERLTFAFPENSKYQIGLLKSYRLSGDYNSGISSYKGIVSKGIVPEIEVKNEYIKLNLLQGNNLNILGMLGDFEPESPFRNNIDLTLRMITQIRKVNIEGINTEIVDKGLLDFYDEALALKYKSPFLAGTFSTLLPGAGKVYSGRWQDGMISLLFIAATSFQAYRGFDRKGVKSAYGWIMSGITFGFYIGNIYGSAKSARLHNRNINSQYIEKVTHYYIDNL